MKERQLRSSSYPFYYSFFTNFILTMYTFIGLQILSNINFKNMMIKNNLFSSIANGVTSFTSRYFFK